MPASNQTRPLHEIALEVSRDWGDKVYFGAVPYLDAMFSISKITDQYGYDSADSIVRYFLANSRTWKGDKAREVKAELKAML